MHGLRFRTAAARHRYNVGRNALLPKQLIKNLIPQDEWGRFYLFIYSNIFIEGKNIISHWLFYICALFYDKHLHEISKHIFKQLPYAE